MSGNIDERSGEGGGVPGRGERLESGRTAEHVRLDQAREQGVPWNHFPHDHARSRVCRWGEGGFFYDVLRPPDGRAERLCR